MNEQPIKKQSFLHGAAILALATAIVKVIGALYKIPLGNILDLAGYANFSSAYDIYSVLMMVSTTGLPLAMSRMISAAQARENNAQIKQIYKASLLVFLTLGIVGFAGMLGFCKQLAMFQGTPNAWPAIVALSPAVFFVCVISSYRGFFQGQSNMTPTSVSQVFEALSKLILGLAVAWILLRRTGSMALAAAGAISGVTMGTIISAVYLGVKHRKAVKYLSLGSVGEALPMKATIKELLVIAIPITIGSAGLQLLNFLDVGIFMSRLVSSAGVAAKEAESLKGVYNLCQTLFNLPASFIVPLTVSIIPSITGFLTMQNNRGVLQVEESSIRIMSLLAMPCAFGLACLAGPILTALYNLAPEALAYGTPMLMIFGAAVIFNCFVLLTNAIMQAHGNVTRPLVHMLIGGVVKVAVNYTLVGIPSIGIVGAPVGSLCCFATIMILNLIAMKGMLGDKMPRTLRSAAKPFLAAAVMGGAAWAAGGLITRVVGLTTRLDGIIVCAGGIAVGVVVYVIMVLALKIITLDDCMLLPKGEKIAKFLKIH